jgi:chemotaxis protein MotB
MNLVRCALLIPLIAVLALSGCKPRGSQSVELEELRAENQRLTLENDELNRKNSDLTQQLKTGRPGGVEPVGAQLRKSLGGDIEGTSPTERGGLALNEDFAFAKGSAELNPEGKRAMEKLAARLNEGDYAAAKVIVEGHTDDVPVSRASTKEKYVDNWGLSGARAASVVRALQAAGVDARRLHGAFRGEHAPRVTEGDKAKNRRVEIYLGE